jgi:hypothetical protein
MGEDMGWLAWRGRGRGRMGGLVGLCELAAASADWWVCVSWRLRRTLSLLGGCVELFHSWAGASNSLSLLGGCWTDARTRVHVQEKRVHRVPPRALSLNLTLNLSLNLSLNLLSIFINIFQSLSL